LLVNTFALLPIHHWSFNFLSFPFLFFLSAFIDGEVSITDTSQLTGFELNVSGKTRYLTWLQRELLELIVFIYLKIRKEKLLNFSLFHDDYSGKNITRAQEVGGKDLKARSE